MANNSLLTEKQRQLKYLGKLPANFDYPLFNARRALESQRSSGYQNTAAAAREIIDNSIEAGADKIHVVFDADREEGKRAVRAIAFIDNGAGMLPDMARYALSWGGGTHYEDHDFIGKFGFGLPNASINQTRVTEVYTRMEGDETFTKATLDINSFQEFGSQSIPETEESDLPDFVHRYLARKGLSLTHGTVVVWAEPDRLTFKKSATLKEHLVDDFGVTYRYLLVNADDPLELVVEGVQVKPVDPIFLMPESRYYLPQETGGAQKVEEFFIPVVYHYNTDKEERELRLVQEAEEFDPSDESIIAAGTIYIKVSRLPFGFAEDKKSKRDETTDANRRFDIRKGRRGMSFVRAGREIQTIDAFPRSVRDVANGLGQWPMLQNDAYHWGVETSFSPELDEVLGITNDKQGVRPIEDFWRVLSEAGVDVALNRENNYRAKERKNRVPNPKPTDGPSAAEQAAKDADGASGTGQPSVPEERKPEAAKGLEDAANQRARITDETIDEARRALEAAARRRTYRIEYYSSEDGPFYKPEWIGAQIVVRINQAHPFYQVLYGDLMRLAGGTRAKEAVDLLLITLSRAELTAADEEMSHWYATQRKQRWSPFLETSMTSLRQRYQTPEDLLDSFSEDETDAPAADLAPA